MANEDDNQPDTPRDRDQAGGGAPRLAHEQRRRHSRQRPFGDDPRSDGSGDGPSSRSIERTRDLRVHRKRRQCVFDREGAGLLMKCGNSIQRLTGEQTRFSGGSAGTCVQELRGRAEFSFPGRGQETENRAAQSVAAERVLRRLERSSRRGERCLRAQSCAEHRSRRARTNCHATTARINHGAESSYLQWGCSARPASEV